MPIIHLYSITCQLKQIVFFDLVAMATILYLRQTYKFPLQYTIVLLGCQYSYVSKIFAFKANKILRFKVRETIFPSLYLH